MFNRLYIAFSNECGAMACFILMSDCEEWCKENNCEMKIINQDHLYKYM